MALGFSKNKLATESGLSHTEINRIENGDRAQPSVANLKKIADALHIPHSTILAEAGYTSPGDSESNDISIPETFTEKQQETVARVIDGLARNADLKDEDLDSLVAQVEMFLNYAKNK